MFKLVSDPFIPVATRPSPQELFDRFSDAARRFGLTVSLKKTEVLLQPANHQNYTTPRIKAGNVELRVVDKFCYFGSVLSSNTVVDDDISSGLSKANVAFGRLSKRLLCSHGISTATKVAVYRLLFCHPFYMVVKDGPCIITFRKWTRFTCDVSETEHTSSGKNMYLTPLYSKSVKSTK